MTHLTITGQEQHLNKDYHTTKYQNIEDINFALNTLQPENITLCRFLGEESVYLSNVYQAIANFATDKKINELKFSSLYLESYGEEENILTSIKNLIQRVNHLILGPSAKCKKETLKIILENLNGTLTLDEDLINFLNGTLTLDEDLINFLNENLELIQNSKITKISIGNSKNIYEFETFYPKPNTKSSRFRFS